MEKKYTEEDLIRAFEEGGWRHDWEQRCDMEVPAPNTIEELIKSIEESRILITYLSDSEMMLQTDPISFSSVNDLLDYICIKHQTSIYDEDEIEGIFAVSINENNSMKATTSIKLLSDIINESKIQNTLKENKSICVMEFENSKALGEYIPIYFDKAIKYTGE